MECLVNAGADLASQDRAGRTPLMAAIANAAPETNIRKLIDLYEGSPALTVLDRENNNVLHLLAERKESSFTKEIVQARVYSRIKKG